MKRLPLLFVVIGLGIAVAIAVVTSCSDSTTSSTGKDSKTSPKEAGITQDLPQQNGDLPINPDTKFQWPDSKTKDTKPWPHPDSYSESSPFGCLADSDCFGQKCCPTPWGVKLCAPTCDLK
jgi:hypothetical protein